MTVGGMGSPTRGDGKAFLGVARRCGLVVENCTDDELSRVPAATANRLQCKLLVLESSCIH
jgi:hypothetical protein